MAIQTEIDKINQIFGLEPSQQAASVPQDTEAVSTSAIPETPLIQGDGSSKYDSMLELSDRLGVPTEWIDKLITKESAWNPSATNTVSNAKGLIQFIPSTARSLGYSGSDDLVQKNPTIESQLKGPVYDYLSKQAPFADEADFYLAVFHPASRGKPLGSMFPSDVRSYNPQYSTIGDFVRKYTGADVSEDGSPVPYGSTDEEKINAIFGAPDEPQVAQEEFKPFTPVWDGQKKAGFFEAAKMGLKEAAAPYVEQAHAAAKILPYAAAGPVGVSSLIAKVAKKEPLLPKKIDDAFQKAKSFTRLSEEEQQKLAEAGWKGELTAGVFNMAGQLPLYMAGGGGGMRAASSIIKKVGIEAVKKELPTIVKILGPKAEGFIREAMGQAIGFGALGAAQGAAGGVSEGKSVGETAKQAVVEGAKGLASGPIFAGGGAIGGAVGKKVLGKVGEVVGHTVGTAGAAGGLTALEGGSVKDILMSAAIMGIVGSVTRVPPGMTKFVQLSKEFNNKPSDAARKAIEIEADRIMAEQSEAARAMAEEIQSPVKGLSTEEFAKISPEGRAAIEATVKTSETDPLTGLLNRRGVERKAVEAKVPIDVSGQIMVDIDHFKSVNDKYGHPAGDEVLRGFGNILAKEFGNEALIARVGGEEFSIIPLSNVSKESILNRVENAREVLRSKSFAEGKISGLTFSAGYGDGIKDADAQLYNAKHGGRAQTFINGAKYEPVQLGRSVAENEVQRTDVAASEGRVGTEDAPSELGRVLPERGGVEKPGTPETGREAIEPSLVEPAKLEDPAAGFRSQEELDLFVTDLIENPSKPIPETTPSGAPLNEQLSSYIKESREEFSAEMSRPVEGQGIPTAFGAEKIPSWQYDELTKFQALKELEAIIPRNNPKNNDIWNYLEGKRSTKALSKNAAKIEIPEGVTKWAERKDQEYNSETEGLERQEIQEWNAPKDPDDILGWVGTAAKNTKELASRLDWDEADVIKRTNVKPVEKLKKEKRSISQAEIPGLEDIRSEGQKAFERAQAERERQRQPRGDVTKDLPLLSKDAAAEMATEQQNLFNAPKSSAEMIEKPNPMVQGGVPVPPEGGPAGIPIRKRPMGISKYAGSLNLDKADSWESAKLSVENYASFKDQIDAERRGKMHWQEVKRIADAGGGKMSVINRQVGQAHNAEQLREGADLLEGANSWFINKAKSAIDKQASGLLTDRDKMDLVEARQKLAFIHAKVMGAATEAGRALNILNMMRDPLAQARAVEAMFRSKNPIKPEAIQQGEVLPPNLPVSELGKGMKGHQEQMRTTMEPPIRSDVSELGNPEPVTFQQMMEGIGMSEKDFMKAIEGLAKIDLKDPNAGKKLYQDKKFQKFFDRMYDVWMNWGLLSGPVTHVANIVGTTTARGIHDVGERPVATAVEYARYGVQKAIGKATKALPEKYRVFQDVRKVERFFDETPASVVGYATGLRDVINDAIGKFATKDGSAIEVIQSLSNAIKASGVRGFLGDLSKSIKASAGESGQAKTKLETTRDPWSSMNEAKAKKLAKTGGMVKAPGNAMRLVDNFFKGLIYNGEMRALAVQQARKEGLKGTKIRDRVNEIIEKSKDIVQYADVEPIKKQARMKADYFTYTQALDKIMNNVMKMRNTVPGARYVVPFVKTPTNLLKYGLERLPVTGEAILIKKMITKELKGAEVSDQIAKIIIGHLMAIPVVLVAKAGSDAIGITGAGPRDAAERETLRAQGWMPYSVRIGNQYVSYGRIEPISTIMGTMADFVELSKDAAEGEEGARLAANVGYAIAQNLTNKTMMQGLADVTNVMSDPRRYGERFISKYAATLSPAIVRQASKAMDKNVRKYKSPVESFIAGTPAAGTLPERLDLFGRPVEKSTGFVINMFSPVQVNKYKNDPVVKEMLKLRVYKRTPDDTYKVNGVTKKFTPQEYKEFSKMVGERTYQQLSRYINSNSYARLSDDQKKDYFNSVFDNVRTSIKHQFVGRKR